MGVMDYLPRIPKEKKGKNNRNSPTGRAQVKAEGAKRPEHRTLSSQASTTTKRKK